MKEFGPKLRTNNGESADNKSEQSYLNFLCSKSPILSRREISPVNLLLERSVVEEFASLIKEDLNIDFFYYSPDVQKGLLIFLSSMKGFASKSLEAFAAISPVYTELATQVPKEQWSTMNVIQAYFYNPEKRDALVRSLALMIDQPDLLKMIVQGRLLANYYGELIGLKLGDEALSMAAELADCDNQIVQQINQVSKKNLDVDVESIKSELRGEGARMLSHVFGKELYQALEYDPDGYNGFATSLLKPMQDLVISRRIFLGCCKQLRERGVLDPKEILGSEFKMVHSGSFGGEMRRVAEQMLRLQEKQYGPSGADYQTKYPELFNSLKVSLEKHIENPDASSRFYFYTHKGELVGFFRFDDEFDAQGKIVRKHMASVMGDPKYKGGKLMETLLEQTLQKEHDVPITAECDPTKPIAQKYLDMGFVKKGERDELGLHVWDIELPAKQLVSKE